jgi:hypothetical protein
MDYTKASDARQAKALRDGSDDDWAWFGRHHGRNYRLRKPIGVEHSLLPDLKGGKGFVVVRQTVPGERLRAPFGWRGPTPLNSEAVCAQLFAAAISGRNVTVLACAR